MENRDIRKPAFYANWSDDNHCMQAAVMMVLNTIDGPVPWEEVNKVTQYEDGLYSWTSPAVIALAEKIPAVRLISRMDYEQFAQRGEEYLKEYMSPQWFELQQAHASLAFRKEQSTTKKIVELGLVDKRDILTEDIEKLLGDNLLIALVDAGKLAGQSWSSGHFVLVYGQDEINFYLHDPGLPPQEGWVVSKKTFMESFGYELIIVPWSRKA